MSDVGSGVAGVNQAGDVQAPIPYVAIAAVMGVVAAYALCIGYTYPALAYNLEAQGYPVGVIGAQAAMTGLGIIVGSLAAPWLAMRFGAWPAAAGALVATCLCLGAFGFITSLWIWFPLRAFMAATAAVLFVVTETWINQLAPNYARGRIIAVYTSMLAGSFALGPLLIPLIGFSGVFPYLVVAGLLAVLGSPILIVRHTTPAIEHVSLGAVAATFTLIPLLLLVVGSFGFFDAAVLGLWAPYSLAQGVETDWSALLLSALILGNLFLQYPIGWIADRTSRRKVLIVCAMAGFLGAMALPFVDLNGLFVVPYFLVWGALAFGTYTIAMTLIGEHLVGAQLVAANAGFSLMWGVGNLVGSGATGGMMEVFGMVGFPLSIALCFGLLTLATIIMVPVRTAVKTLKEGLPDGGSSR